ncbi:unnamed protein product [Brachionus calyciflorus]|uniref:ATP-grasp domain-containing protein n=1 Tax=Brachionus calyciflorus TaxID=104777 RepID=A0A813T7C6_9BILA|nr:unnamed protein product [Brachionus calyciflorus]
MFFDKVCLNDRCDEKNQPCTDCKIIASSCFNNFGRKKSLNTISLEKQTVFFHQNQKILEAETQDLSDKNVLLVGCGSIKRYSVLKSLKCLNFKKFVCLSNEKTWAFTFFDDWIKADSENLENIEQTLKSILEYEKENGFKFDAIFTYDDYSILVSSYLANYFSLPSIPFELAQKIKNKFEFRKLCKKKGITHPKFFFIHSSKMKQYADYISANSYDDFVKSPDQTEIISFPVMVKNSYGSGKDFIYKCNNFKEYLDCIHSSMNYSDNLDLVIEEFYDGHEIDIEILIQDNIIKFMAISDNFPAQEPSFYEKGGVCPSIKLTQDQKIIIQKRLGMWLAKLNFQNACLHFEARCKPELISEEKDHFLMPIEINQRLGGAETWSMIQSSFNVNLIHESAKIALGIQLNEKELLEKSLNPRLTSISHDFHSESKCLIKNISLQLEDIQNDENIVEISLFKCVDDQLYKKDYIGWVTVKCDIDSIDSRLNINLEKTLNFLLFEFDFN